MKQTEKTHTRDIARLPWTVKIGVGFGSLCESVPYYLFITYFLYYLTNIVGISPAIAGSVCSAAIVFDGLVDPFIGYWSDNSRNPKGRRIPIIKKAALCLCIVMILMFMPNSFSGAAAVVYYLTVAILMWGGYSFIVIPWLALVGELTDDFTERNQITVVICVLALPFMSLANSGPMWIQQLLLPLGFSEAQCWFVTGICGALLVAVGAAIVCVAGRGRESVQNTENVVTERMNVKGFLETFGNLLRLKQYRLLLFNGFFFMASYTLCTTLLIYVMQYVTAMNEAQIGTFWLIFALFTAVGAPAASFVAGKTNKKIAYMAFTGIMLILFAAYYFMGMATAMYAYVFSACMAFGAAGFWTMYYSMLIDNIELYEFVYGKRREGAIASLHSLVITSGGAVASLSAGFSLELVGYYGGTHITESISRGMLGMATMVPAVILAVAIVCLVGYRLDRKEFAAMKEALELKKQGKAYSTELFERVL